MSEEVNLDDLVQKTTCTLCGVEVTLSKFIDVPDDYKCYECGQLVILASDAGVVAVFNERRL